jgi:hypothetical protein
MYLIYGIVSGVYVGIVLTLIVRNYYSLVVQFTG